MKINKKGETSRETESLLKAAKNNAIRTNNMETKIDNMPENSKCRLHGDRDETLIHKRNTKLRMACQEWWFTGNFARD